jgi:hypothetical protein
MQIGRMGFARVQREDHALVVEIDFHILHSGNLLQHRSQLAHALIAFFPFSRDFDRFQNRIVAAPRKKWIGRIGISGSAGSMAFSFPYLTCGNIAAVAFGSSRFQRAVFAILPHISMQSRGVRQNAERSPLKACATHFARHRLEDPPHVFREHFVASCIWMNAITQI